MIWGEKQKSRRHTFRCHGGAESWYGDLNPSTQSFPSVFSHPRHESCSPRSSSKLRSHRPGGSCRAYARSAKKSCCVRAVCRRGGICRHKRALAAGTAFLDRTCLCDCAAQAAALRLSWRPSLSRMARWTHFDFLACAQPTAGRIRFRALAAPRLLACLLVLPGPHFVRSGTGPVGQKWRSIQQRPEKLACSDHDEHRMCAVIVEGEMLTA